MALFPARTKIQTNMKAQVCSQHFSYCKYMGEFFRRSRAANTTVYGPIRLNYELSPDFTIVIITCKNEDPIEIEGARVFTKSYINFSDA